MASPYSTGGGGTHFEARVAATYLAATLCEAPARGLPGFCALEVRTQRASDGEPLDDLIVIGVLADGRSSKLSLQVKSSLKFSAKDNEWQAVVVAAWDTFSSESFDEICHRIGVAVANYDERIDKYYQSVLGWAAYSASGADFVLRIQAKDFSNAEKRSFVDGVQAILSAHIGRNATEDELWRFLKSFVLLHFDLNLADGQSRDAIATEDRLRDLLSEGERQGASAIWAFLVAKAGQLIPAGGSANRATLVEALAAQNLPRGTPASYRSDLETLNRESQLTLAQIGSEIAGLRLFRAGAYERLRSAFSHARFVQIDGEPGAGKSALLKGFAEECARHGPVFVLKDRRIHPKGWSAHAHVLGICPDPAVILREFGCSGDPVLFIDGIDKIDDPAEQLTINDLITTIAASEALGRWRVVVTVRGQNLRHIETWLNGNALKILGLATVSVGPLTKNELGVISDAHPQLAPLLRHTQSLDVILSRPFFIDALLSLARKSPGEGLPATEVDLLRLWWSFGGADDQEPIKAQHRRNALMQLARSLAASPSGALAIGAVSPEPITELKSAGVLRDKDLGHSVIFTHDIYEEWTLCEFLLGARDRIPEELRDAGEPQSLIRPMQLLGTYFLETETTPDAWEALLVATADESLRPVWNRAVLTAPLQSTQGTSLLETLTDVLLADGAARLCRLLTAIRTIEVIPNPLYLNETTFPNAEPAERVKLAEYAALPKTTPWLRFLSWLAPRLPSLPPELIPDLLPVLRTWLDAWAGQNVRYCRDIGTEAYRWLQEFESASYTGSWETRRKPFGVELRYKEEDEIESAIRQLFLTAAGDVPQLVTEYLLGLREGDRRCRQVRDEVISCCAQLIRHLPKELVDFILSVFLEHPDETDDPYGGSYSRFQHELGVAGHDNFYPASPANLPFLPLLRLHEAEGLRLVKSICNHSIRVWRWSRSQPNHYAPATPLAVTVYFPWGRQRLWGDSQVYVWFRGFWGNDASKSALMALEQWALEVLDGDADFAEVFRKCVEGQESVAALGLGASLCLAHPGKSIEAAFPLATSPYVWQWDIARLVLDQRGIRSNEIGDWYRYRSKMQAVRDLNERPHRGHDIRSLVPYFVVCQDRVLARRYVRAIRRFPKRPPFEYEEQKLAPEFVANLEERLRLYVEQGDPKFWKVRTAADGEHVEIYNDPPSLKAPKHVAEQQERQVLNQAMGLTLWAQKTLEDGALDARFSLSEALSLAQTLDAADLFDVRFGPEALLSNNRASGVAGTACALAIHSEESDWSPELAAWCADVLHRAATVVEVPDSFAYRGSATLMHPTVFAVHGYSGLLARAYQPRYAQDALINLAVDALDDVVKAIYSSTKRYAEKYPEFARVLLVLGLKQCVSTRDRLPNYNSLYWDETEAEIQTDLLDWAQDAISNDKKPDFPTVPRPWVRGGKMRTRKGVETDWTANEELFRFDLAEKILLEVDLSWVLSEPAFRAEFLEFASNLVDWTIQQLVPPFADARSCRYESNPPFEWIYAFSAWCGKLGARLSARELKDHFLDRVLPLQNDASLMIMQSFMRLFMIYAFLKSDRISDDSLAVWNEVAEWLFQNPEWRHNRDTGHLGREYQSCAMHLLFCAHNDFGPVLCAAEEEWPELRRFLPLLERAVLEFGQNSNLFFVILVFFKRGGFGTLPSPALSWLETLVYTKRADQDFWDGNGSETVALLRQLIERRGSALDAGQRGTIQKIADVLVDNGVRGAGFLQQELLREAG